MVDTWRTDPWRNQGGFPVYDDTLRAPFAQADPAGQIASGLGAGRWGGTSAPAAKPTTSSWGSMGLGDLEAANAYSTVNINGQQVKIPGYYEPGKDREIFENSGRPESAMGRLTRRLSDYARGGGDPSDPNVIYREMARVRDDAGARSGQTGFVHLDRFVRGGNGEQGFSGPQGANTAYQAAAPSAPATQATPQVAAQVAAPQTTSGTAGGTTAPGNTGGSNVSGQVPPMGAGLVAGAQVAGQTSNPQGGVGPAYAYRMLQDPAMAYAAYRAAQGQTGRNKSAMGDFKQSLFGQALSSLLNMDLTDNPGQSLDNINQMVSGFGNAVNGGNLYGTLKSSASNMLGRIDPGKYDDADLMKLFKMATGATGLGMSPIGASGLQSQLDDLDYQRQSNDRADDFSGTKPLGGYAKDSPFWRAIAAMSGR